MEHIVKKLLLVATLALASPAAIAETLDGEAPNAPIALAAALQARTESAYSAAAVSPKGEVGLIQLMSGTAKR